jgi:hypothetical protein
MKPLDQPLSLAEATKDEDEAIIVDADTMAGTKAEIATAIRNIPAHIAN